MTIGIFGGSFNPIHTGHAIIANYISQQSGIDEVWIMVSKRNPLKRAQEPASDIHRLKMAELTARECGSNVKVSDLEMRLPAPSYSYETLKKLKEENPKDNFKLIIGSDNLEIFDQWRNSDKILDEFGLIIYSRPGHEIKDKYLKNSIIIENGPSMDISSTFVRDSLKRKLNINYLVPLAVATYIKENKLYT